MDVSVCAVLELSEAMFLSLYVSSVFIYKIFHVSVVCQSNNAHRVKMV